MTKNKSRGYMAVTAALFVLAIGLLLFSTIGSTRAAFVYSQNYQTYIHTEDIDISLSCKNGSTVSTFVTDSSVVPGKNYKATISVSNSGDIDEYVRIVIHRYWLDPKGKKDTSLDPSLIGLTYDSSVWTVDTSNSDECIILYSKGPVKPGSGLTVLSGLTVDSGIATTVRLVNGKYSYAYDGYKIGLDIEADGVQTHNAADAMQSAWGR